MIGMDKELEYLIETWKRVRISLRNTERAGNSERMQRRQHKKNLWEETLRRRLKTQSVGAMDGREPTWKKGKRQDMLVENRYKQWELLATQLWMWMYAVMKTSNETCSIREDYGPF